MKSREQARSHREPGRQARAHRAIAPPNPTPTPPPPYPSTRGPARPRQRSPGGGRHWPRAGRGGGSPPPSRRTRARPAGSGWRAPGRRQTGGSAPRSSHSLRRPARRRGRWLRWCGRRRCLYRCPRERERRARVRREADWTENCGSPQPDTGRDAPARRLPCVPVARGAVVPGVQEGLEFCGG